MVIKQIVRYVVIIGSVFVFQTGFSQSGVNVKADMSKITVGDHFHLDITVTASSKAKLQWPIFKDSLASKIDIVSTSNIDTTKENTFVKYHQRLTLTSFDSGAHAIPQLEFPYLLDNDTTKQLFRSDSLIIAVTTVPVDTTKTIKEIKDIADMPLSWEEIWPWAVGGVGILALVILGIILYRRYRKNEPLFTIRKRPVLPPHEQALLDLEILRREKLWQSGRIKEYYTRLTDILRIYIEAISEIKAMEMTTDEILAALSASNIADEVIRKAKDILAIADLVKFAKMDPLPDEHDRCLQYALTIIDLTKPKETTEK